MLSGKDYYSQLAPYFLNMHYVDSCDGLKADDFQLQLADRDRRFISDWSPDIGTFLDVSIITERWFSPNGATLSFDCGRFWIDSVEFELPQSTLTIKASSIPTGVRIKAANETRGWENSSLKKIAQQIASESNMTLDWQADGDPQYTRTEQTEESALAYLRKRAEDAKLSIKVHRNSIVIFDEQKWEEKPPSFSLVYGDAQATSGLAIYRMSEGKFNINLTDALKKAKVKKSSVATGQTTNAEWTDKDLIKTTTTEGTGISVEPSPIVPGELPPSGVGGQVPAGGKGAGTLQQSDVDQATAGLEDNVNEGTDNEDEGEGGEGNGGGLFTTEPIDWENTSGNASATTKAKAHLRKRNKDSRSAEVELSIGNPLIAAGMTFNLIGLGQYDDKWFVFEATHEVGPEYKTKLKIRRCLKGY
jgi:phage protein D